MALQLSDIYEAANKASKEYFNNQLGGQDSFPCGFAWVRVYPKFKGNTKEGRKERKELRRLGFELNYAGKVFEMCNPSGLSVQNVNCQFVGAQAVAELVRQQGFTVYADSMPD